MSRNLSRVVLPRRILIIFLLAVQFALMVLLIVNGSRLSVWIEYGLTLISFAVVFRVVSYTSGDSYKLIWVILILIVPIFGGLFYLLFHFQTSKRRFQKDLLRLEAQSRSLFLLPGDCFESACAEAPEHAPQMHYLQAFAGFPVYRQTQTEYLPSGEAAFERLVEALKKAERYIFLEYFIIREGVMWNTMRDILVEKAAQGVEIRVMYDDVGCFLRLPKDYHKRLEAAGIACAVFNPFRPFLTAEQNNRDHRKIAVIDGRVAFTGGINLSDEYVNAVSPRGHWKDAAIRLEGAAAWSFALMFLQMWSACKKTEEDFSRFFPLETRMEDDGLVQPYADSPMDFERVGEHVYLQIINKAKKYVYISTPYLIIDDSLTLALTLAAKSGVDVRIVTPHRGDRWFVHMTTRSYYRELVRAGVKIYEYSDGFLHSKTFVSDDAVATVGTTNLDFRSLYLHFECGVWMYQSKAVAEIRDDFIQTLDRCYEITEEDLRKGSRAYQLTQDFLRLFAPIM